MRSRLHRHGLNRLFVQENIVSAQRLLEAGVSTELYIAPGGCHGFDVMVPEAAISKRFTAAWNDVLSRILRPVTPKV
jgi:acetyl esterase/lipase